MGRKSRLKKQYSARARKAIKEMLRDATPEPYSKRTEDGKRITKDMAEKYMNFLKSRMEAKKRESVEDSTPQPAMNEEVTDEGQS